MKARESFGVIRAAQISEPVRACTRRRIGRAEDDSRGRAVTEAEWCKCVEPRDMVWTLRDRVNLKLKRNERRLRLFGVACCRRIWHLLDDLARRAVEAAELCADGAGRPAEMLALSEALGRPEYLHVARWTAVRVVSSRKPTYTFMSGHWDGPDALAAHALGTEEDENAERVVQSHLLRDIFGNPFRPVAFSPEWRTGAAVALARQMYESREFSAMPILADALQDAGCDTDAILSHCRGGGPHVRGCWVVDLVLGKE